MKETLKTDQVVEVLVALTGDLEAAKDHLTELDAAVGDGDLGISICRGFRGVREGVGSQPQDIGRLFVKAGMDFSNSAGSTMGALLGTAFMRAGKAAQGKSEVGLTDIAGMVKAASDGIREKGKAQPGDKTMLDALVPAADSLAKSDQAETSLVAALERALTVAEEGMKSTVDMKAAFGRARWLGERTIGHPDPGAAAVCLMLKSVLESLRRLETPPG